MKAIMVAAVLGSLATTGCSVQMNGEGPVPAVPATVLPSVYDVHVATAWSSIRGSDETGTVFTALGLWHGAVGVRYNVTLSDDPCPATHKPGIGCFVILPQSVAAVAEDCGDANATGCTFEGPRTDRHIVAIVAYSTIVDVPHTLLHEIGHAMGLEHVQDTNSIMYPTSEGSPTITQIDVSQYRADR